MAKVRYYLPLFNDALMSEHPSHPHKHSETVEPYIQKGQINRLFNRLGIATSTLHNGINQLFTLPPDEIKKAVYQKKGGVEELLCKLGETRGEIKKLLVVLSDFMPPENEGYDEPDIPVANRPAAGILIKIYSGMTGCRNSIIDLLEDDRTDLLIDEVSKSRRNQFIVTRINGINRLLADLEAVKLGEIFGAVLKNHREGLAEYLKTNKKSDEKAAKHLKQKREREERERQKEKAKNEAFFEAMDRDKKQDEARRRIAEQAEAEQRRLQEETDRQARTRAAKEAMEKAEKEKEGKRKREIAKVAKKFSDAIDEKKRFIQDSKRLEIANEIYCYMADGEKLTFDILSDDFPEIRGNLERQLEILKKELAIIGIKLMGTLRPEGKHTVKYAWIK